MIATVVEGTAATLLGPLSYVGGPSGRSCGPPEPLPAAQGPADRIAVVHPARPLTAIQGPSPRDGVAGSRGNGVGEVAAGVGDGRAGIGEHVVGSLG